MNAKMGNWYRNLIFTLIFGLILFFSYAYSIVTAQSEFDYYLVTGSNTCGHVFNTSANIRTVIPGQEEHILGTYSYGYYHDMLDQVTAPGDTYNSALERVVICPRYNLDDYWVDATMQGGGSGGYIVSYKLYMRRENSSSFLLLEEENIGGMEEECLTIDGELSGNIEAVWTGSYYYGMQLYADGTSNSKYCGGDGVAYARLMFTVNLSDSPTPTPTGTPTLTPTPANTPTETPPPAPTATHVWYQDCQWVTCGENEYCGPGGACYFNSPLATPTPPATPTPASGWPSRMRILAAPDGCDGTELIPSSCATLDPNDIWGTVQSWPHTVPFNVRYTFQVPAGSQVPMRVSVNSLNYEFVVSGPSEGETEYYEITVPPYYTIESSFVDVDAENLDNADTIFLYSVCVQPADYDDCRNPDPGLDAGYAYWDIYGDESYIQNGMAHLVAPFTSVYQGYQLEPGQYKMEIDMQAKAPGPIPVRIMANDLDVTDTLPSNVRIRYEYQFNLVPYTVWVIRNPPGARFGDEIEVYRVCLKQISAATPTPSVTPTPTPPPETFPGDPSGCDNPDPGFNIPGLWTMYGAQIDDGILSLRGYASEATENVAMPHGTYNLSFSARAVDTIATECVSKRLDISFYGATRDGLGVPQITKYIALIDDGDWHTFNTSVHLTDPNPLLGDFDAIRISVRAACITGGMQRAAPLPVEQTWLQMAWICVGDGVGDGTPTPTISPTPTTPPGMTATPTPTGPPPPVGCANYDPGIDGTTHWIALNGATIANSIATIPPAGSLLAEVAQDSARQYYVNIVGRCTYPGGAVVSWRNDAQTWSCDSSTFSEYTFLFSRSPAPSSLAQPLSAMLDDNWQPQVLFSPLEGPAISPQWNARLSSDFFQIAALNGNGGQLHIQSVCVKDAGWIPEPDPEEEDIELYHPVCERDYSIQRVFQDNIFGHFYGMLIGPGRRPGMPVHVMGSGQIVAYGEDLSYVLGDNPAVSTYTRCVMVDHSSAYNASVQSIYCNLDDFSIPSSMLVERGAMIGHTSAYVGDNGLRGDGLMALAVQVEGTWVDPRDYFVGYPDCRPYAVAIEPVETCAADDGSGIIPPRFNPVTPDFLDFGDWVPWLAMRFYDVVGYPILCALIPMMNTVIDTIVGFANALIQAVSPPLIFLYRIGRIFEYMLYVFKRVMAEINALFDAVDYVSICIRTIIVYFISAIRAASDASITVSMPEKGNVLTFGVAMALVLISSTVANVFLTPIVGLFCAFATWKIVPWGIKTLRKGAGFGQ